MELVSENWKENNELFQERTLGLLYLENCNYYWCLSGAELAGVKDGPRTTQPLYIYFCIFFCIFFKSVEVVYIISPLSLQHITSYNLAEV